MSLRGQEERGGGGRISSFIKEKSLHPTPPRWMKRLVLGTRWEFFFSCRTNPAGKGRLVSKTREPPSLGSSSASVGSSPFGEIRHLGEVALFVFFLLRGLGGQTGIKNDREPHGRLRGGPVF